MYSFFLSNLQNNKDYFDQGLDEVKLLRYVNAADPGDESGLLRLHDFFYFKVSLHAIASRSVCMPLPQSGRTDKPRRVCPGLLCRHAAHYKPHQLESTARRSTWCWSQSCCVPTCTSSKSEGH